MNWTHQSPTAVSWNQNVDPQDGYEANYTSGFPLRNLDWSINGVFNAAFAGIFGTYEVHRKNMTPWLATVVNENFNYIRDINVTAPGKRVTASVALQPIHQYNSGTPSRARAADLRFYRGFGSRDYRSNLTNFESEMRVRTLSEHVDECAATNLLIRKPKMSWEGYQPSITVRWQVPRNHRSVVLDPNMNYGFISGFGGHVLRTGMKWERQRLQYRYVSCRNTPVVVQHFGAMASYILAAAAISGI